MQSILLKMLLGLGVVSLLAACGENGNATTMKVPTSLSQENSVPAKRSQDFAQVARGGRLFQENCAVCHGKQAEGAPNWRQLDPDGLYPPPPLNGTGHAWHHPKKMLHYVIKNGSPGGKGKMPAWKEKLSDEEINDIIAWFMSRWPDEVYQAWTRMGRPMQPMGG